MGLYYIIYHSSKIKDHKNNCNVSYTNPFQLKRSVKNLNFCVYFQCEKLTGNEIFTCSVYLKSFIHTDLQPKPNPRHPVYLVNVILNDVTNFHVHTAICSSVIPFRSQSENAFYESLYQGLFAESNAMVQF